MTIHIFINNSIYIIYINVDIYNTINDNMTINHPRRCPTEIDPFSPLVPQWWPRTWMITWGPSDEWWGIRNCTCRSGYTGHTALHCRDQTICPHVPITWCHMVSGSYPILANHVYILLGQIWSNFVLWAVESLLCVIQSSWSWLNHIKSPIVTIVAA